MRERVRSSFLFILFATILLGGAYWYRTAWSQCQIPIMYSIGTVDQRFDIEKKEIRSALSDAESLWEDATGKNLFTYAEDASFTINLIYDSRQDTTNKSEIAKLSLNDKQAMSEKIRGDYEHMLNEYEKLKVAYAEEVASYEERLAKHNREVEEWNQKGGAPEEVFERLHREQGALARESASLNATAKKLNQLVTAVNSLGEKGNEAVVEYNEGVAWYNSLFGTEREFTQGEYRGDRINIYQFETGSELRRVLAHEFGHALSLGHTEGERSVMHYLMEGKNADFTLSSQDLAEYERVCGSEAVPWYR